MVSIFLQCGQVKLKGNSNLFVLKLKFLKNKIQKVVTKIIIYLPSRQYVKDLDFFLTDKFEEGDILS